MGLFSRRKASAKPSTSHDPNVWIGRKFRTNATIEESIMAFESAKDQCYDVSSQGRVRWVVPVDAASFQSTQGTASTVPPARLISYTLTDGGRITLALWEGMVSFGEGSGVGGPPREMWFVPSGFDRSPLPIAGIWTSYDSSLSSIGWVESPLWGATHG